MNVAIYIYNNAEVLDFAGPFEVFSTANRFTVPKSLFNVFLIAETAKPVAARGSLTVNPHFDFTSHPKIDVLLVAGGLHEPEMSKPHVLKWITSASAQATVVTSVCTGVFILAEAGVIKDQSVTTHWDDLEDLSKRYPSLKVVRGIRWVDENRFVTSAGISAGIDMSLHLVSRFTDTALANKTAKVMDFQWQGGGHNTQYSPI